MYLFLSKNIKPTVIIYLKKQLLLDKINKILIIIIIIIINLRIRIINYSSNNTKIINKEINMNNTIITNII